MEPFVNPIRVTSVKRLGDSRNESISQYAKPSSRTAPKAHRSSSDVGGRRRARYGLGAGSALATGAKRAGGPPAGGPPASLAGHSTALVSTNVHSPPSAREIVSVAL